MAPHSHPPVSLLIQKLFVSDFKFEFQGQGLLEKYAPLSISFITKKRAKSGYKENSYNFQLVNKIRVK